MASFDNLIGDVVGSSMQSALSGTKQAVIYWPQKRSYTGAYGLSFGYTLYSDDGTNSMDSTNPANTVFIHGLYNNMDGSTTWAKGITQSLPASFYIVRATCVVADVPSVSSNWPGYLYNHRSRRPCRSHPSSVVLSQCDGRIGRRGRWPTDLQRRHMLLVRSRRLDSPARCVDFFLAMGLRANDRLGGQGWGRAGNPLTAARSRPGGGLGEQSFVIARPC